MISVEQISPENWKAMSADAHKLTFHENKPVSMDRIDFALLPVDGQKPMGYVTCRELDCDTLYWQFGGAFPETKDTVRSWSAYKSMVDWCKPRYKRITTRIENTNIPMLKMAMKVGFRIVGIRFYQGVLLEHLLEFEK